MNQGKGSCSLVGSDRRHLAADHARARSVLARYTKSSSSEAPFPTHTILSPSPCLPLKSKVITEKYAAQAQFSIFVWEAHRPPPRPLGTRNRLSNGLHEERLSGCYVQGESGRRPSCGHVRRMSLFLPTNTMSGKRRSRMKVRWGEYGSRGKIVALGYG